MLNSTFHSNTYVILTSSPQFVCQAGALPGVKMATSRWPEIWTTSVALPHTASTHRSNGESDTIHILRSSLSGQFHHCFQSLFI